MEIKGLVEEITPTQQVTASLKKREIIIKYVENVDYPEFIKVEAIQDRCNLLDSVKVGDEVEVFFNLKGRPWVDKTGKKTYFNSLQLWRINVLAGGSTATPDYAQPSDQYDDDPF